MAGFDGHESSATSGANLVVRYQLAFNNCLIFR
jgi:hypothetical protein